MRYSEGLDMPGVSDLASAWGQVNKDQSGLSYHLQYAQSTTFGLFLEASLFRLTGWFNIHLFLFI